MLKCNEKDFPHKKKSGIYLALSKKNRRVDDQLNTLSFLKEGEKDKGEFGWLAYIYYMIARN